MMRIGSPSRRPALALLLAAAVAACGGAATRPRADRLPAGLAAGWQTDFTRHSVPLREFTGGGPGRDGIPPIDHPRPVGLRAGDTFLEARERWGRRAAVARFDYAESDRAVTAGGAAGFAQLVGDPRGRLVGATIAAPAGGEAIAELAAWMAAGRRIDAVSHAVHACLRWCGFVATRREHRTVHYRIADARVADLLSLGRALLADNAEQ